MATPLVSIAIPTHNRAQYAYDSILSILRIDSDRLEIVVSDTSHSDALKERIESLDLSSFRPQLNYIRSKGVLNMTENHEAAVSAARGDYVCLIGDDDTVTSEIVAAVDWASARNVQCLAPSIVANYAWPDFRTRIFGFGHAGRLYLPKRVGAVRSLNSATALSNSLRGAAQGTDGLPKLYHGFVRRELLGEIRRRSGAVFHGSSPDVSVAIGLACILAERAQEFQCVDYPLTIPGASGGSNTGRSAMNNHKGSLSGEEQTSRFVQSGWSIGVPKFFSVETVWAHACLSTLKAIGNTTAIQEFAYPRLLALCYLAHPEFSSEIEIAVAEVADLRNASSGDLRRQIQTFRRSISINRWNYRLRRVLRPTASGGRPFVGDLQSISDTPAELQAWLDANGLDVSRMLVQ